MAHMLWDTFTNIQVASGYLLIKSGWHYILLILNSYCPSLWWRIIGCITVLPDSSVTTIMTSLSLLLWLCGHCQYQSCLYKKNLSLWDSHMLNNALQDNLFEWHFTIRGPADSEFDGGLYHGRIILPPEYPMKPPSIILLTVSTPYDWKHVFVCLFLCQQP